ncbi:MAG: D-alanyl-D-alanine carboxypeptidase family protein [Candidatus Woesearchaeota archaeon]
MKRTDKKSQLFVLGIMFIIVSSLIIIFILFSKNFKADSGEKIGDKEYIIFKTYQEGEYALLFIDQSAKLSVLKAISRLGETGGYFFLMNTIDEGGMTPNYPCGQFIYPLYSNEADNCFPDYDESFKQYINNELNNYLSKYPNVNIPTENYKFIIKQEQGTKKLNVIGLAIQPIIFSIGGVASSIIDTKITASSCTNEQIVGIDNIEGITCKPGIRCMLAQSAADGLKTTAENLRKQRYTLLISDAYRTLHEQEELKKQKGSGAASATCATARHAQGQAIDVSKIYFNGHELDTGLHKPYPFFYSQEQQKNHDLLQRLMCENGWIRLGSESKNVFGEWWHFEYNSDRAQMAKAAGKCTTSYLMKK